MERLLFLKEFLRNIREVGSVSPSSKFLTKTLLLSVQFKTARTIVELGGGSGVVTRQLLRRMHPDAELFVFEINMNFASTLRTIPDHRLHVMSVSALQLSNVLRDRKADYIISGLPLSTLSGMDRISLFQKIRDALDPNGIYLQFQYIPFFYLTLKSIFRRTSLSFVFRNVPPAFI